MHFSVVVLLALSTVCASASEARTQQSKGPLLFYATGDRRGEVEPCSCPGVQLGGLQRLVRMQAQTGGGLYFDAGNTFFSLPELPESRKAQGKAKAELIAQAYRLIGMKVLVPGSRDAALGIEVLRDLARKAGVKLISSNFQLASGEAAFDAHFIFESDGIRVGVAGFSLPDSAFLGGTALPVESVAPSVRDALIRAGVQVTVAVVAAGAPAPEGFDVVLSPEQEEGKSVVKLSWDKVLRASQREVIELTPQWNGPNALKKSYEKYLSDLHKGALDRAPSKAVTRKVGFVAEAGKCRSCHQKQYDFWASTKHASAYLVLFAKNQNFDPECITCHSVGFQKQGGFDDITAPIRLVGQPPRKKGETPFVETFMSEVFVGDPKSPLDSRKEPARYAALKKRYHEKLDVLRAAGKIESLHMGVQCEHCHGSRVGHPSPRFKKVGKVAAASCTQCHHTPHDLDFRFKHDVAKVGCPTQ